MFHPDGALAASRTAFKREHPCPATHLPTGPCPGYIIDHVIALKRADPAPDLKFARYIASRMPRIRCAIAFMM